MTQPETRQVLISLEYERSLLGGVIQYPDTFVEISPFISGSDLSRQHGKIWDTIRKLIENKGTPTPVILAYELSTIGVKLEGVETVDYLDSLRVNQIRKEEVINVAKELKKLSMVRRAYENADLLKESLLKLRSSPVTEISAAIDKSLGESLMVFDAQQQEAINLYDGLDKFIEDKGNNPIDDVGFKMPFKLWGEYYGGLRRGGLYFTASRSGQGKSTFLSYVGDSVANDCNPGLDIKVLFLDTEMDADDQRIRLVAARVGCPYFLIDTGQWRMSLEWEPKMRAGLAKLKTENRNLWFKQVSSLGTDDLVNFVKRWYYKNVGTGGNCFIVYDYLKVLVNDGDSRNPEWLTALHKMQRLKDLALEINAPVFTALQVNRIGTTTNKSADKVIDDESVLSISGRIDWLVNFGAILRRKTPDEIAADGKEMGSHKLIPLKSRFQGRVSQGHHDLVTIMEKGKKRYKQNYLCFEMDNFNVKEKGDYRLIAQTKGWTKISKDDSDNEGEL